jgi:hypothetical protein
MMLPQESETHVRYGLLGVLIDPPGAVKGSVASVAVGLLWYGAILLRESRVWKNAFPRWD